MRLSYYKWLAGVIFIIAGGFVTYEHYFIGIVILLIGYMVASGYSCRYCGKVFDIRRRKSNLYNCPRCGKKVDWKQIKV